MTTLINKIVKFLAQYFVRWSLKFVGSILTYIGWDTGKYEEMVMGIFTFVVGAIISLVTDKKSKN